MSEPFVLHCGNSLDILKNYPDNHFDSIVTDPPYGISFMGRKWDYDVPSQEIWAECLRVLKPGGHLLAFAGTRTQHRMAVRIEDAGFEIRDMIAWVYGCLSEDSEYLTKEGWVRYNTPINTSKEILVYDHKADVYKWETPERWSEYRVESDTAYRIRSDHTDQIVSRGHRCLVERDGVLVFVSADELSGMERVPYLQGNFSSLPQGCGELLLQTVLREGEGVAEELFVKRSGKEVSKQGSFGREEPGMERWSDALQTQGEVRGSQEIRAQTSYRTTVATISPIEYTGLIWCPTVSTGAFVARRNGKIFVTGNSGFPKSLNVSKAIDKAAGAEREILSERANRSSFDPDAEGGGGFQRDTIQITDAAKKWDGWGTSLKPALEPITVARKPLIGTVAENVLAHGTGALNIDGCRVGSVVETWPASRSYQRHDPGSESKGTQATGDVPHGRWPANLIHDGSDEVVSLFPHADKYGSAARFFYCAKASRADRDAGLQPGAVAQRQGNRPGSPDETGKFPDHDHRERTGNFHPTVKPTDLMAYLCRLVTPPNGIILDPFMGSGSTGKAAIREGFKFVGIDMQQEYVDISNTRISHELKESTKLKSTSEQLDI